MCNLYMIYMNLCVIYVNLHEFIGVVYMKYTFFVIKLPYWGIVKGLSEVMSISSNGRLLGAY